MFHRLAEALFATSPAIRYVALEREGEVELRERAGLADASASESDRYEELLVNPTLLELARRRGDIDCGGLDYPKSWPPTSAGSGSWSTPCVPAGWPQTWAGPVAAPWRTGRPA